MINSLPARIVPFDSAYTLGLSPPPPRPPKFVFADLLVQQRLNGSLKFAMPPKTRSTSTSQPAGNKRGKKAGTSKKSIAVKREDSVVEGANHFPFLKLPAELRNKM